MCTGADHYIHWLLEQCQLNRRPPRILYGITQSSSHEEQILDRLRGYEDSRPVRIGNAAADHLQLDVFGEVIASIHSLLVLHGEIPEDVWELVCSLAEMAIENWRRRDRGVWEVVERNSTSSTRRYCAGPLSTRLRTSQQR